MSVARALTFTVVMVATSAHAHLMAEQRGTLNVVGEAAFLVVSLPASAFATADLDADGRLSPSELSAHQAEVTEAIVQGVTLRDDTGTRALEGVMLSLVAPEDAPGEAGRQLVALGRFPLAGTRGPLRLRLELYGADGAAERITVTRGSASHVLALRPGGEEQLVLPNGWQRLGSNLQLGFTHILAGLDHLLFLLVALAGARTFRALALTLTCFTAGHALTLTASLYGSWHLSPSVVEPTIAATIVLMAVYDWRHRRRGQPSRLLPRLALVFGCALVHGFGLATGLTDGGLAKEHLPAVLLGFNLGVELGQLVVCIAASAMVQVVRSLFSQARGVALARVSEATAAVVATAWFVERVF